MGSRSARPGQCSIVCALKDEPTQLIPTWGRRYGRAPSANGKSALTAAEDAPMVSLATGRYAGTPSRKEHVMRHRPVAQTNPHLVRAAHGKTCTGSRNRVAAAAFIFAVAASLLPATMASAGSMQGKRPLNRPPPYPPPHTGEGQGGGHGFLPGYEPPEVIAWERARTRRPAFWYGGPGFYRGRWNGGGFGPCWTPTPIGPHWNCG